MWKKLAIGLFVAVALFVWNGVGKVLLRKWLDEPRSSDQSLRVTYAPKECAYRVSFPVEPEISKLSSPGVTSMERAQAIFSNHFVRATCMTFAEGDFGALDQAAFHQMGRDLAIQEGLESILVAHSGSELGDKVTISGSKRVQGQSFKVKYEIYHRGNVRFTVVVGGLVSGYPQAELLPFLQSVANN